MPVASDVYKYSLAPLYHLKPNNNLPLDESKNPTIIQAE